MSSAASVRSNNYPYDVALSFAGEQRPYVDKVAKALKRRGLRPFYDKFEQANLWGKDLYEHLDHIYRTQARYCIIFASGAYAEKIWTTHERRSAQARALGAHSDYILPVRFDDTEIPGILPTISYIDATVTTPAKLAAIAAEKIGPYERENYLPSSPTRLFYAVEAASNKEREACFEVAHSFMRSLERMTVEERRLVAMLLRGRCPEGAIEEDPHMNLDVLRRDLSATPEHVIELFRGISSLGVDFAIREDEGEEEGHEGESIVSMHWNDMMHYSDDFAQEYSHKRSTEIAEAMVRLAADSHCLHCGLKFIDRLDFSRLANTRA